MYLSRDLGFGIFKSSWWFQYANTAEIYWSRRTPAHTFPIYLLLPLRVWPLAYLSNAPPLTTYLSYRWTKWLVLYYSVLSNPVCFCHVLTFAHVSSNKIALLWLIPPLVDPSLENLPSASLTRLWQVPSSQRQKHFICKPLYCWIYHSAGIQSFFLCSQVWS